MIETTHSGRALVLGGGGSAGNAWLIGVIAGLHDAGLDVTRADVVIGTSAGATTAAQIAGASPHALLRGILDTPAVPPRSVDAAPSTPRGRPALGANHLERLHAVIAASSDAADWRRRMSAALLADPASGGAAQARWHGIVSSRLSEAEWPDRPLRITAVNAHTAEAIVFEKSSGVDLVDAVAASTAGGFAYRIGDDSYIDGGYRSNADNADLASGYARVLVLSPLGGRSFTPVEWGTHLSTQMDGLRADGSEVEAIFPDADSVAAFGDNMMDPATRQPAARAGTAQGRAAAARLSAFWG